MKITSLAVPDTSLLCPKKIGGGGNTWEGSSLVGEAKTESGEQILWQQREAFKALFWPISDLKEGMFHIFGFSAEGTLIHDDLSPVSIELYVLKMASDNYWKKLHCPRLVTDFQWSRDGGYCGRRNEGLFCWDTLTS